MGHLINPTAFRLSEFTDWKDNWVSTNNIAYTELLHNTMSLKEIVRHYITKPDKAFHQRRVRSPLIFSHMSVEQTRVDKLFLKVYFYDTDVESSYRLLRMACKRIHRNQRRLYRSFLKVHSWLVRSTAVEQEPRMRNKLFFRYMAERGFFEYLILRKIIFLFLCAVFRDKFLSTHRGVLLQIKLGLFSLLEFHWRKNLFYNRPMNFFEFFINVFLQMQFLERDVSPNVIRATMFYIRKRFSTLKEGGERVSSGREIKELLHLVKWFKFGRMSLIAKLSSNPKIFDHFSQEADNKHFSDDLTEYQLEQKTSYDKEFVYLYHGHRRWVAKRQWRKLKWERRRLWLRMRKAKNKARFQSWMMPSLGRRKAKLKLHYYYSELSKFNQKTVMTVTTMQRFPKTTEKYLFTERVSFLYLSKMSNLFSWLSENDLHESTRFKLTVRPQTYTRFKRLLQKESPGMQTKVWNYVASRKWKEADFIHPVTKFYNKLASPESFFALQSTTTANTKEAIEQMNTWTLFAYTYARYSYLLWTTSKNQLTELFANNYLKRSRRYRKFMRHWSSFSIWANQLFLDFYRVFFVRARYLYSFGFQKLLLESELNRVSLLPVSLDFFGFDNDLVTASFVAFYLSRKILQNFQIRDLFDPITKDFRRIQRQTPYLLGYKLQFVGRLTRRDRLRTSWVMGGSLPLSTATARVDYSQEFGILRNGMCSIRVWLYRPKLYGDPSSQYLYKIVY